MIYARTIWYTIGEHVRFSRGIFSLIKKPIDYRRVSEIEIPSGEFLIPLIKSVDKRWPFDIEPTPRVVGQLIELLRSCRFLKNNSDSKVAILPDINLARNLGAFDTPDPVVKYIVDTVVTPLCTDDYHFPPPFIVDPACGAGYFLLEAFDVLAGKFPKIKPEILIGKSIRGFDIDTVAIELSIRNIRWHIKSKFGIDIEKRSLEPFIRRVDALSDLNDLPIISGSADGVIGNPPYQFFSGRGSPVAALRKAGKNEEADLLERDIDKLSQRFPQTSIGCKDRYKWFINRSVELLRDGGTLGFITPNTWIAYPRYRDVRTLLDKEGYFESVIDLGFHAFKRAHVPASIMIWRKEITRDTKEFPLAVISSDRWGAALDGDTETFHQAVADAPSAYISSSGDIEKLESKAIVDDRFSDLISFILNAPPAPHRTTLGEITVLREGSHAIRAVRQDIPKKPTLDNNFPVIIDKTLGNLIPPDVGYIKEPAKGPVGIEHHKGERFFIRKTGDSLIVAPSPTDDFALAHQNVYVGKLRDSSISLLTLIGILSSRFITDLYRAGPGGQHHRPHAQFRILFLNRLPIIISPELKNEVEVTTKETVEFVSLFKSQNSNEIEPIPRVFPSDEKSADKVTHRINVYHAAIEMVTAELIERQDDKLRQILDSLVYWLYSGICRKY